MARLRSPDKQQRPADLQHPGHAPAEAPLPAARPAWAQMPLADVALLALTALLLFVCYLIARPFISALAWAAALAVVWWPLHRRLARWLRPPGLCAGISVLLLAVVLIVLVGLLVPGVIDEAVAGSRLIRAQIESGAWDDALERQQWIQPAWEWLKARLDLGDMLQHAGALLTTAGSLALRFSLVGSMQLLLMFFFLFFFLRDRDGLLAGLRSLLPLAPREADTVLTAVGDMIFATLYGKLLVGVVQGALGGLMFWWLGFPAPWFWALVMGLLSILPLLGPALIWLPAAAVLLLGGHWIQAVILIAWGAAVVGLADNLLYPIVVGRHLRLHTVPLLIAMIGGLLVFGPAGFFLGPVMLTLTMSLLQVWRARTAAGDAAPGAP